MSRPNFLLITSDQQRWDSVGWQNPDVRTPHLSRLAERGIVYDRAYTASPVCTPSRCSMLTGHYPSRHGAYTIGCSLPEDYPTLPGRLTGAGYFTSLCGKGHFSSCCTEGMFESAPNIYDTDFFRGWSGPFYGFEHAQLVIDHGDRREVAGMHYGAWLEDQGVRIGDYFGLNGYNDFGVWNLPEDLHYSKWTADRTIDAIERSRGADKPFFIWSSFQDPHNPCFVPEPWASLHREKDIADPIWHPEEFEGKPPFYRSAVEDGNLHAEPMLRGPKDWACMGNFRLSGDAYRRHVRLYRGMVSLMDHHIGRIIGHLERTGQLANTVIVFTSDHGDYFGHHGLWWKWLFAYEDAHRVPFLVYDPACRTPGGRSDALQSLVDIPLTFTRRAGLEPPPGMQGVDQSAAWTSASEALRDHVIVEFRPTEGPFMQKTLVCDEWKLVQYSPVEYGELYNLRDDPDQLVNLWDKPDHLGMRCALQGRLLRAEMQEEGVLRERTMWA